MRHRSWVGLDYGSMSAGSLHYSDDGDPGTVGLQSVHGAVSRESLGGEGVMKRAVVLVFISILFLFAARSDASSLSLHSITLPPGFAITIYADDVPNARGMTLGKHGTVF